MRSPYVLSGGAPCVAGSMTGPGGTGCGAGIRTSTSGTRGTCANDAVPPIAQPAVKTMVKRCFMIAPCCALPAHHLVIPREMTSMGFSRREQNRLSPPCSEWTALALYPRPTPSARRDGVAPSNRPQECSSAVGCGQYLYARARQARTSAAARQRAATDHERDEDEIDPDEISCCDWISVRPCRWRGDVVVRTTARSELHTPI